MKKIYPIETSLNMGFFNVTDNVPLDIKFYGKQNKNKLSNIIFVLDRAYFKYDFFNYLDKLNIKYVVRIKSNSKLLCFDIKNSKLLSILKKNRIIKYVKIENIIKEN